MVKVAKSVTVGTVYATQVGTIMNTAVGMMQAEEVGIKKTTMVGKSYNITAGDAFTLTVGSSSLTLNQDGTIILQGVDIQIIGSTKVDIIGKDVNINPEGAGGASGGDGEQSGVSEPTDEEIETFVNEWANEQLNKPVDESELLAGPGGGSSSQDQAWAILGEAPPSKAGTDAAKKVGKTASEIGKAIDTEVTDPVNYVPGGVLGAVAKKFPSLGKWLKFDKKNAELLKAIDKERSLAKKANWKKPDGTPWWPDNTKGYDKVPGSLTKHTYKVGDQFSRYSSNLPQSDKGSYVAPLGTTFGQRAMPGKESDYTERIFKVKKPLETNRSTITPWFDQPGLGKQDQLPKSIQDLIKDGSIEYMGEKK